MPASDIAPSVNPPMRPAPAFPFDVPSSQTFGGTQQPQPSPPTEPFEGVTVEMPSGAPWTRFRVVGRLSTGYAVLETNDGYTLLDPAAAHERVLYEKLLGLSGDSARISQRLLIPQSVELKPLDFRRIENVLPLLKEMGFGIEPFGKDTFMVDAIPDVISGASCEAVLLDTATALDEAGGNKRGKDRWREEIIAKSASRAAVRTGGALSPKALNSIILELAACEMPYTSPFGRPTMIFTSFRELDRRFGRN
jgi:DNA mismatch repair protein MutL